ncbi:hypothetical protein C478_10436 [Natrinema thermotolerans DSM 11552]|nr:hypothetical protein C478_10436 [Natrinema thermotolerans DSM 11552]
MPDDPTQLSRLLRLFRQAGAPSEDSTDRDGAFSYHAESHAAGLGIGLGAIATATGNYRYVGGLLAAAFGLNRGPTLSSSNITGDVRQEPHYFIGGLALGLVLGAVV